MTDPQLFDLVYKMRQALKLKANHIIFWWYYRLVDDHFKQFPIIQSIKLLRSHYEHEQLRYNGLCEVLKTATKEVEHYRKEAANLRIQMVANSGTIDQVNSMFGTDFKKPDDN